MKIQIPIDFIAMYNVLNLAKALLVKSTNYRICIITLAIYINLIICNKLII